MATKPEFTQTGTHASDLWLVDGSPDFAIFPSGTIESITEDTPIHLKVGTPAYGAIHIQKRERWYKQHGFESAAAFVYFKLSHSGPIYTTEVETKIKIMMRLNPNALLVLEHFTRGRPHFSVTTIYQSSSPLDGEFIGRYPGRKALTVTKVTE
jgi:hypothetical protein